jgi:hypothetical protein
MEEAEIVTGELVPVSPAATLEEYRPRIVMAPEEAKALDGQLRSNMRAVLHEGSDYGQIPGAGDKPVLLKPGAEKLLQWFGFGHAMERAEIDTDADGGRLGVTYRCTVTKGLPDGRVVTVAMCEGYAGYDEDRFFTSKERSEEKERANAERYRRAVNPSKCMEYRAPWNTVIKMAQKRAMVGAALQATSASSLFTQDMEDMASGDAQPAALAAAGRAVVGGLPQAARTALDTWYQGQGWPGPDTWTAEQWCAALVQAGKLSATDAPTQPQPPAGNGNAHAPAADESVIAEWGARIDEITCQDDASKVIAELTEILKKRRMDPATATAIRKAVNLKAAQVNGREPAGAR